MQLIELRRRAEGYKTRAEGGHLKPFHLSRHRQRDLDIDSSTITSSSCPTSHSDEGMGSELSFPSNSPPSHDQEGLSSNQEQGHPHGGQPQLEGKQKTQLFTRVPAHSGEGDREGNVHTDDSRYGIKVEDVEESWESGSIIEDTKLSQGNRIDSSMPQAGPSPPPVVQTRQKPLAKLSTFERVGMPSVKTVSVRDGEIEGRISTPELRKSKLGQQSRHHLDITTPSGGGLLISPTKPVVDGDQGMAQKSVELPFPPTSPKYRRDMKSKAPILPSPQPQVGNGRQDSSSHEEPLPVSDNVGPRSIPSSSSPYHAQCVPHPPHIHVPRSVHTQNLLSSPIGPHRSHQTLHKVHTTNTTQPVSANASSFSGPVRKLLFESHTKNPMSSSSHHKNKLHTKTSSLSAAKSSHSNVRSCETCGAHLRSSNVLGGGLGVGHSGTVAPPTDLSRLYQQRRQQNGMVGGSGSGMCILQSSSHQSRAKLQEIRSKLASHSLDSHHYSSSDAEHPVLPDSGLGSSSRDRELRIEGGLRRDVLAGRPGEGVGVRRARDVDELSLSSLSLSSCSVASDVLRKARDRRDRFWTQPSHITAS